MRPRDNQKQKVYRFERLLPDGEELSLDDCETLVCVARLYFGLFSMPKIVDGRGTRIARGSAHRINLPKWSRTARTVLHEAAHSIVDSIEGHRNCAFHGPEFVAVFLLLYERFTDSRVSLAQAKKVARAFHVRVQRGNGWWSRGAWRTDVRIEKWKVSRRVAVFEPEAKRPKTPSTISFSQEVWHSLRGNRGLDVEQAKEALRAADIDFVTTCPPGAAAQIWTVVRDWTSACAALTDAQARLAPERLSNAAALPPSV